MKSMAEILSEAREALAQQDYKQKKLDSVYLNIAKEISTLSHCQRAKVGAVIVKDGNIVSFGYNGTPSSMDNCCENGDATISEVIHAEMNAILKAAKSGYSVNGATLYLTLSPCKECSKLILQSGIERVLYLEEYRDVSGIEFLHNFISIKKYDV
jgi:dCMP deaminase